MSTEERPSERAMRLATETLKQDREQTIMRAIATAKRDASPTYKWAYIPVSEGGQCHGPIYWFKTRKEADKYAEAIRSPHAIARYWRHG